MRILYLPSSKNQQRQFQKPNFLAYPVRLAMEAEWYRKQGHEVLWDKQGLIDADKIISISENLPFLSLPHPDRVWTNAKDKKYQQNGNFKYHPGTYIMSASGCWHGKCSFCVEQNQPYEVRPVEDVISEIEEIKAQNYREAFDDSATFPVGNWLNQFCDSFSRFRNIRFSCNMRMVDCDYDRLRQAGFRMLLFGLESANQQTLDKIGKGVKVEDYKYIIKAAKAGLENHIACMVGYPWETLEDTFRTINLVKWLLIKGYAKTAQMSFYTPPQGQEKGNEEFRKYVNKFYEVGFDPRFWWRKIVDIHNIEDFKYLIKGLKEGWRSVCKF